MKVGLIGFGKAGKAVATVILRNKSIILEWVVRKSELLSHRSIPEFLGEESDEPGLIYSSQKISIGELFDKQPVDAIIDFSSETGYEYYADEAAKRKITIISAVDWPQTLKYAPLNELENEVNVIYGIMFYYGDTTEEEKNSIIKIKEKGYPVIVTEWGYQKNNPKEKAMNGGQDNYAKPLGDFMRQNKIGSFAWCYHPTRQPCLLNSWNPDDLSEWGKFLKEYLSSFNLQAY